MACSAGVSTPPLWTFRGRAWRGTGMTRQSVALCLLAGVEAGHPDGPLAVSRPLAWCSTRLDVCPPPQGTAGGIPSHGERSFDPRDVTGLFLYEPSNESLQLK